MESERCAGFHSASSGPCEECREYQERQLARYIEWRAKDLMKEIGWEPRVKAEGAEIPEEDRKGPGMPEYCMECERCRGCGKLNEGLEPEIYPCSHLVSS